MLCPNASCSMLAWQGAGPEIAYNPAGSANSYVIETPTIDSPLHITFRSDSYFTGTGLELNRTKEAISLAAQTWGYDANHNMFYYNVYSDPLVPVADGDCMIQFSPSISSLGFTYIWMDGSGAVTKANMILSTNYAWTTDYNAANTTNTIDLQSVVLHELGHIVGLGDLYDLPSGDPRKTDYNEIMNLYRTRHPQHNTGVGDRAGLQSIYGCGTVPTTTSTTTTTTTTSTISTTTTTSTTTSTTSTTPSTTTTITLPTTTTTTMSQTTTSTYATTTTIMGPCPLAGDYPPCDEVSLSDNASLGDVVGLIIRWSAS
jgi:M6 family metalloprotease-like protein